MADVSTGTNPTIFLRLNSADPQPRELAWEQFHARYAPIIAAFVRRLGAGANDIDDVVQDVMLGFFSKSPTFVYDPAQGRFRGYLKVCACRALRKRADKTARFRGQPLDLIDPEEVSVEQAWADVWQQERLRLALESIRKSMSDSRTFAAFEQYVILDQPADQVAQKLGLHINSVYRAKEQITGMLQKRLDADRDED
jgi:RNA polymerase sigma factor (sigma-70 family)